MAIFSSYSSYVSLPEGRFDGFMLRYPADHAETALPSRPWLFGRWLRLPGSVGPDAATGETFFFPSWFNQFEAFLGSIFQEEPEQSMRLHWDDGPSGHHHLQLLNVLWHRDPLWPQSSAWLWCLGRCYILLIPVGYQKCGFSSNVWGLAIKHGNMPDVNHGCLMIDGFL